MDYKQFREKLKETIRDHLPERLQHTEPILLTEINGKEEETVLLFTVEDEELKGVSFRVKDMYEHYSRSEDFEQSLNELLQSAATVMDINVLDDVAHTKENIIMQLLNTEANEQLLATMPHREYEDMSIVYRLMLEGDEQGYGTLLIADHMAEALGLSENEMYEIAMRNVQRLLQPKVKTLQAAIYERVHERPFEESGIPEREGSQAYLMSGLDGRYGAAIMLDQDTMQIAYEQLQSNLYIVPISTDECVICKSDETSFEKMHELIEMLPAMTDGKEPALSKYVYYYDGEAQALSVAANPIGEDEMAEDSLEEYDGISMGGM